MTPDLTNTNLLCITQDDVIRIIKRIIKIDGLDAAREAFRHMNEFFSGVKGWAETTEAVYQLIADIRKEEKQQSRKEKLEDQRAGASHFKHNVPDPMCNFTYDKYSGRPENMPPSPCRAN
jgi:hypothetical protein